MKKQLAKLIDLKSILTIMLVGTLIYGFIVGKIDDTEFIPLVTMVLTFYFTKKKEVDINE